METNIKNIGIHYYPGARGDFLASFILNSWHEGNYGSLVAPKYNKKHLLTDGEPFATNCIKIRIDANCDTNNAMQIMLNHFIKDKDKTIFMEDQLDHMYLCATEILLNLQEDINPSDYDYWIDFSKLNDIEFLTDFYMIINGSPPSSELVGRAIQNISVQKVWESELPLVKMKDLIDWEYKMKLIRALYRTFDIHEFVNFTNHKSLLKLSSYPKMLF